jgi:hypothetical protein
MMEATLEKLTLGNIAEGELERQFQERLAEIAGLFGSHVEYVCDNRGHVRAVIKAEIQVEIDPDLQLSASVRTELVRPKRKLVNRVIYHRKSEGFLVWADEPQQLPLPGPRALPIRGAE